MIGLLTDPQYGQKAATTRGASAPPNRSGQPPERVSHNQKNYRFENWNRLRAPF
jgi:hypothetical protein